MKVLVAQLCLTFVTPKDCSPLGSSVHGISQARILEWVAIHFSRGSSRLRDWTEVSHIAGRFFTIWATTVLKWCSKLLSHLPLYTCSRTWVSYIAGSCFIVWATREAPRYNRFKDLQEILKFQNTWNKWFT